MSMVVHESSDVAAKRRVSSHGIAALAAMLVPAVLFPAELLFAARLPRYSFLWHPREYPWELYLIAVAGTIATAGGVADWLFHRSGMTSVGKPEHRSHVLALLGGGVPLFVLMSAASVHDAPQLFLLPVLAVVMFTTVMISHDEFCFHRRCGRFETFAHRALTFGNGIAFLAWTHWCFVRGAGHG